MRAHSSCCKSLQDADMALIRGYGGYATISERFQAALPVVADLIESAGRCLLPNGGAVVVGERAAEKATPGVEPPETNSDSAVMTAEEIAVFAGLHRLAINVARELAAAAAKSPKEKDTFARLQRELQDVVTAAWAKGHHVTETVAKHLGGMLAEYLAAAGEAETCAHGGGDGSSASHAMVTSSPRGGNWSTDVVANDSPLAVSPPNRAGVGVRHGAFTSAPGSPLYAREKRHSSHVPGERPHGVVGIEDFDVLKLISSGAYGKVFLCRKHTTQDVYAIKVIRKKDLIYKNMTQQAMAERDALIHTDNPFIVKLFYSFASTRHLYIVT